jgi:hypothetical protein
MFPLTPHVDSLRACLDFTEDIQKRESVRILVSTKSQVYAQEV